MQQLPFVLQVLGAVLDLRHCASWRHRKAKCCDSEPESLTNSNLSAILAFVGCSNHFGHQVIHAVVQRGSKKSGNHMYVVCCLPNAFGGEKWAEFGPKPLPRFLSDLACLPTLCCCLHVLPWLGNPTLMYTNTSSTATADQQPPCQTAGLAPAARPAWPPPCCTWGTCPRPPGWPRRAGCWRACGNWGTRASPAASYACLRRQQRQQQRSQDLSTATAVPPAAPPPPPSDTSPVAMSQGMMLWQLTHCSCVSGPGRWQKGHGLRPSGGSSPLSGLRTISSIFFLYLSGTSGLHGQTVA